MRSAGPTETTIRNFKPKPFALGVATRCLFMWIMANQTNQAVAMVVGVAALGAVGTALYFKAYLPERAAAQLALLNRNFNAVRPENITPTAYNAIGGFIIGQLVYAAIRNQVGLGAS